MNQINNPETQFIAQIERLELEARNLRRRIEHAPTQADRAALNRQMKEIRDEIDALRRRLR